MGLDESAYIDVVLYLYLYIGILFFYFGIVYIPLYIIFRAFLLVAKPLERLP